MPKMRQGSDQNSDDKPPKGPDYIAVILKVRHIGVAQERMLKIAKMQSKEDFRRVQDVIEQVSTPGRLILVGWEEMHG